MLHIQGVAIRLSSSPLMASLSASAFAESAVAPAIEADTAALILLRNLRRPIAYSSTGYLGLTIYADTDDEIA